MDREPERCQVNLSCPRGRASRPQSLGVPPGDDSFSNSGSPESVSDRAAPGHCGRDARPPRRPSTSALNSHRLKRVLLYGTIGGVLIAILKFVEYQHFVRAYPAEVYGGILALIFTAAGIYVGLKWTRPKEVVVVKEVRVREGEPFILNDGKLKELGITPREHEILGLIAQGLSNREIGEKLFVSENTVKTHSSRLFEKMSVNRRTQAVQKGKELGLIP